MTVLLHHPSSAFSPDTTMGARALPAPLPTTAHGRTTASAQPVVAIDVDGVLNPDPRHAARHGYHPHHYDGPDPRGNPTTGVVWLHPAHGPWLLDLRHQGADLVWCTTWGHLAPNWIAPRLGLPGTWPVIDVPGGGVRWGSNVKLGALYQATGTRPVAVLDDQFGPRDPGNARQRTAAGSATLLVPVHPTRGLTRAHITTVATWLAEHRGPPR